MCYIRWVKPRRIDQILSSYGYCSRREADSFLRSGRVCILNEQVKSGNLKARVVDVTVDGAPIDHPEGLLLVMNKPLGLVCSHDPREGPNVYSLLPELWMRRDPIPATIGRLDKDTSGVLLITDNGQLNHRWTSPKHKVEKVYQVTVDKPLTPDLANIFASGTIQLDGEEKPCLPSKLALLSNHEAELTLIEGKYHQVRRMFASLGYEVLKLHRSRFGDFDVSDLQPGEWKACGSPDEHLPKA